MLPWAMAEKAEKPLLVTKDYHGIPCNYEGFNSCLPLTVTNYVLI